MLLANQRERSLMKCGTSGCSSSPGGPGGSVASSSSGGEVIPIDAPPVLGSSNITIDSIS